MLPVFFSTFSGNRTDGSRGVIASGGPLTVTNSTVANNSAGYSGGAILSGGALTVTNSTFSGNSAGEGGGIANPADGATLMVTNSTFVGNTAAGGGLGGGAIINAGGGLLAVTNSTFYGNRADYGAVSGGGIYNQNFGNSARVTNTIIANSTAGGNCAVGDFGGSVTDGGHNVADDGSCGFTGTLSDTNPMLDPAGLATHGGPTQTIALQAGSSAINAGDESVCAAPPVNNLDQRGYVRPGAGATRCSIGAYEYKAGPASSTCTGDCNGHGEITVDEILTMVNIALGTADASACLAGDAKQDGSITVDEILTTVNNALNGCATS